MAQFPLDMAAQVTLIAWTLQELPELEDRITPLLRQALDFASIRDIEILKIRKLDGLGIFGQQQAVPVGGELELTTLRNELAMLKSELFPPS